MEKGLIFDIQGYSVHDGPGCRTLVFLSGCPLRCSWCSNPEGYSSRPRMMFRETKCVPNNYRCAAACPNAAVKVDPGKKLPPEFDRTVCARCETLDCVRACLKEALKIAGRTFTVEALMKILQRDQGYWGEGGGVTFTGGEPLQQPEFLLAVLKACRSHYIHTAVETSAYAKTETLLEVQKLIDWMFIDIKHMDAAAHERETGVSNELILKNIEAAAAALWNGRLVIRVPVIPGFNDGEENLAATVGFMKKNRLEEVNLLPFHRLGSSKYGQLGLEYAYAGREAPSGEAMAKAAGFFEAAGLRCSFGSQTPF